MLVGPGETNEQIVDAWFKTIARQVLEDGGEDAQRCWIYRYKQN